MLEREMAASATNTCRIRKQNNSNVDKKVF